MYPRDMAIVYLINFEYPRAHSFALNTVFFTWNGALRTPEVVSVSLLVEARLGHGLQLM